MVEGNVSSRRYLIIDDDTESGRTVLEIQKRIKFTGDAECVGVCLYHYGANNREAKNGLPEQYANGGFEFTELIEQRLKAEREEVWAKYQYDKHGHIELIPPPREIAAVTTGQGLIMDSIQWLITAPRPPVAWPKELLTGRPARRQFLERQRNGKRWWMNASGQFGPLVGTS